jgi:hypothetical protein
VVIEMPWLSGGDLIAVAPSAVQPDDGSPDRWVLNATRAQAQRAPRFEASQWPVADRR